MRATSLTIRGGWRPVLIATTLMFAGCDAVNDAVDAVDDIGGETDVFYYLSLGDSLSVGVQPNGEGILLPTDEGYADQLFDLVRPGFQAGGENRELRLVKLGCPGETIDDMVNGGSCPYLAGSQLAAAIDFLNENGNKVFLVTIDIGGNDFRNADCIDATVDMDCATTVAGQVATDLAPVLAALDAAADPATTIAGMNYYNPYLASWLEGMAGETYAVDSAQAVGLLTDLLGTTYQTAGILMADVAAAFDSDEFAMMVDTPNGMLPLSVANICDWTYMCDGDPRGPDIHANMPGYAVIAEAFNAVLP